MAVLQVGYHLTDLPSTVLRSSPAEQDMPGLQSITGSYTLQPKMQAIVNGFVDLSNVAVANITAAEGLASYENIHPFYVQVRKCRC